MVIHDTVIILRTTDFRDSDKIISFLGREQGKRQAIARGLRRSKKRFSGGIDIFDHGAIVLEQSQRNRQHLTITEYRRTHSWTRLSSSVSAFSHASLCAEVIDSLSHDEDPDSKALFPLLFSCLKATDKSTQENERASISCFLILSALSLCGFLSVDELPLINEKTKDWYNAMLGAKAPIVPFNSELAQEGLSFVVQQASAMTDKRINSWDAFMRN